MAIVPYCHGALVDINPQTIPIVHSALKRREKEKCKEPTRNIVDKI